MDFIQGIASTKHEHTQHLNPVNPSSHPVCTYSHQVNLKIILVEIRTVSHAVLSFVRGAALPLGLLISLNNLLHVEPTNKNVCYSSATTCVDACCKPLM